MFCFDRQRSLLIYISKRRKCVLLVITMHHDNSVSAKHESKPDIVLFYNETKSGVDTLDLLVRLCTCKHAPSCGQWLCGSKFGLRGSSSIRYLDKKKSRVERTEVAP
ncbi:hypothetical protein T4B_1070 [Trichinella pseudospiralis]|uniref:PiggyBac transposable element-derived protein domain-containing protein n=1 Tax=Trichinella pseudospiralis TaxID=6337 RepID=A0A0V1HD65_TRIPS|nr:hypothetical protein T4A_6791 [Trichinella pseudospiralis]KRZ08116.1 hypothetical protein T4B_1070 [Trichinella pseudospiralis]KRZ25719.1 hypothetical protein T4C_5399 [Trichinella pseudospiralis]